MILITGAGGFIGHYLQLRLAGVSMPVMPLYHSAILDTSQKRWMCDLTRPDHLVKLSNAKPVPEVIVHLAGHVEIALRANPDDPNSPPLPGIENVLKIYHANVGMTANLLEFCLNKGVRHLIFASSQAVYGMPQATPLTEETPCLPLEHYGASKLCCEQLLRIGSSQGLNVTVLRFPGIFSEMRQQGVVSEFCKQAIQSKCIQVKTEFPLPLDVMHIDDLVDALASAVSFSERGYQCFNVSTGEPCSLDILADTIAELVPHCRVEHGLIRQPVVQMDSQKAFHWFGWKANSQKERLLLVLRSVGYVG